MSARRRFQQICVLATVVVAGACSATPDAGPPHHSTVRPTIEVTTPEPAATTACGRSPHLDDPLDALAAAVDELAAVVGADGRATGCAVVAHPVCSTLFLIGATDPIAALGVGLSIDDIDRLADLHHRVLVDGAEAARQHGDVELEAALQAMIDLDVRTAVGRDDAAAVAIAVARSDPTIMGPIASAESNCR